MLQRLRPTTTQPPPAHYRTLTVTQAISLLDRIYDNYFRFNNIKEDSQLIVFTKHFIKVEVLDRLCRPFYEEFDKWPEICLDPVVPKKSKQENTKANIQDKNMTRRSKTKFRELVTIKKEPKAGYCEICNLDYDDPTEHQQSAHHLAFVQNHNNYLSLDELIAQGADVATFLENATPLNGDRKMKLRNMCNGELEPNHTRSRRSNQSQSPDSPANGSRSPRRVNGNLEEEKVHKKNGKRSGRKSDDHQYYKVVGVNTKLRSSGGFSSKKKDSSTATCNGDSKPLVVKFRKVRQSELSVLSDEAEQFMFPKVRTSSTCSSSSEDEVVKPPPKPIVETPHSQRKTRLARPVALKEESSEEDSWPVHKRKRKRRSGTYVKRSRTTRSFPMIKNLDIEIKREVCTPTINEELNSIEETFQPLEREQSQMELNPLREVGEGKGIPLISEEATDKCLRWENGRLKYGECVEQLEFAFESVPSSEPWFGTFKRQDENKIEIKNVTKLFDLYAKSPKLPYEMGQLPPLKPNCCPLSDLVKREEKEKKPGPSRSYGTRGNKEKIKPLKLGRKKSIATLFSLDTHPRKSPREHASTLAILGSVGLMNRRNPEDTKSTASEDTFSETQSNREAPKIDTVLEQSEDLCQFLSNIFDDAADYEVEHEAMEGEVQITSTANTTDFLRLVNECDECDTIRQQIATKPIVRRGPKMKKKNRTGWPSKKKTKKDDSQLLTPEQIKHENNSCDQFSIGSLSETDEVTLMTVIKRNSVGQVNIEADKSSASSDDRPLRLDVKWTVTPEDKKTEEPRECGQSESTQPRKRASGVDKVTEWLQPVVRVSRVDVSTRRLRSAAKPTGRSQRLR